MAAESRHENTSTCLKNRCVQMHPYELYNVNSGLSQLTPSEYDAAYRLFIWTNILRVMISLPYYSNMRYTLSRSGRMEVGFTNILLWLFRGSMDVAFFCMCGDKNPLLRIIFMVSPWHRSENALRFMLKYKLTWCNSHTFVNEHVGFETLMTRQIDAAMFDEEQFLHLLQSRAT